MQMDTLRWVAAMVAQYVRDNIPSVLALVVSLVALWHSYRIGRRQIAAQAAQLAISRSSTGDRIIIRNHGNSPALDLRATTKKGTFVRWSNQYNEALRHQDEVGAPVGGEEPWTTNCCGETRSIGPKGVAELVIAENAPATERLLLAYRDYAGKTVRIGRDLSTIYWEPIHG